MEENTTVNTTPGATPANTGGSNTMMFVIGAIILAGVLGYVIFSTTDKPKTPTPEEQVVVEETTPESTQGTIPAEDTTLPPVPDTSAMGDMPIDTDTSDEKIFQIEAGYPYYKPNVINVKKGDKVKIVLNAVDMMHDFNIDELAVKVPLTKSGETNSAEFVADTAGSFQFYCSVGNHRQKGQVGTLVVSE